MELEIDGNIHKVVRSYYPEEGKSSFEFPILLHGTKIAFKTTTYIRGWQVGFIKVHPRMITLHWISLINLTFRLSNPNFYKDLWIMNRLDQFGDLIELHILESPEVII